uniref:RING-type E3 ubiquitin transferase n=1 Tax=Parastrongyloides trichosuri TaxID=131310 RepID=A0A0N4ZJ74_PARTI
MSNKNDKDSNAFQLSLNCCICLQAFSVDSDVHPLSILPCGHVFGKPCIKKWFETNSSCPYCHKSVSDMKKKIGEDSSNNNNLIIDIYGLEDSPSFEVAFEENEKMIMDYKSQINFLSNENKKLNEILASAELKSDKSLLRHSKAIKKMLNEESDSSSDTTWPGDSESDEEEGEDNLEMDDSYVF